MSEIWIVSWFAPIGPTHRHSTEKVEKYFLSPSGAESFKNRLEEAALLLQSTDNHQIEITPKKIEDARG